MIAHMRLLQKIIGGTLLKVRRVWLISISSIRYFYYKILLHLLSSQEPHSVSNSYIYIAVSLKFFSYTCPCIPASLRVYSLLLFLALQFPHFFFPYTCPCIPASFRVYFLLRFLHSCSLFFFLYTSPSVPASLRVYSLLVLFALLLPLFLYFSMYSSFPSCLFPATLSCTPVPSVAAESDDWSSHDSSTATISHTTLTSAITSSTRAPYDFIAGASCCISIGFRNFRMLLFFILSHYIWT